MSVRDVGKVGGGRREAILTAAIDEFARLGFDGASLREVADACGMQKGHITYYFPAKGDLLYEIIDDLDEAFLAGVAEWASDASIKPAGRLLHVFTEHVRLVCSRQQQTRVAYECTRFLEPRYRRTVGRKQAAYVARIAEVIESHRQHGPVADEPSDLLAEAVLGILVWPYQWHDTRKLSVDRIATFVAARAAAAIA